MQLGRIAVVGDGGLLGEIMAAALAKYGEVTIVPHTDMLIHSPDPAPDVIAVWSGAAEIGWTRTYLRRSLPAQVDPVLIFLSQLDPCVYFTRLREQHVDRRRLGFNDVLNEIAGQLTPGPATTAPVKTR